MFKVVSKAGSSTSTRLSLELQMESCGSSKLKVCKIHGHKYYFVSIGTQPGYGSCVEKIDQLAQVLT